MKRTVFSILMAVVAIVASAAVGDTFTDGDLAYRVISDESSAKFGSVSVTGLSAAGKSKTSLSLKIPTSVVHSSMRYRVTTVDGSAFANLSNITNVTIDYGFVSINPSAFANCAKITMVRLPSSVTTISTSAFSGCTALKTVYMANPAPSDNISGEAFPMNSGMTLYVTKAVDDAVSKYKAHMAFKKFSTVVASSYAYDVYCSDGALLCVTKAPTKTAKGEMTMVGFNKNGSKVVDGEYKKSGTYNFSGYTYDLVSVARYAFNENMDLKKFTASEISTLKTINPYAFQSCESLISVSLPSSLSTIGAGAFTCCKLLTSIDVPQGVTVLFNSFVDGCTKLQAINVHGQNTQYTSTYGVLYTKAYGTLLRCPEGYTAFKKWDHSQFASNLSRIDNNAFNGCVNIQEMSLPYGISYIGNGAFKGCSKLVSMTVPSTIKTWGTDAFSGCTALTTFRCNAATPPTLSSTEFSGAQKKYLYVPYKSISAYKAADGWKDWTNIKAGAYDAYAQNLESASTKARVYYTIHSAKAETINGTAYDGRAQLSYVPNVSNSDPSWTINLPASITVNGKDYAVTSIEGQILSDGMVKDTKVVLGENIDSICESAFQGYAKIVGLTLNPNLKYLGLCAFSGCGITGKIDLPYGLKYIGGFAFNGCPITHLLVPSSVNSMNNYAFSGLSSLSSLVLNISWPIKYDKWSLTGIPTSCRLYVPSGYVNHYAENSKFRTLNVDAGGYDFTFNNTPMNDTKNHITITSNSPVTHDGVTYAGKAKYVCHPAHKSQSGQFYASLYETNKANGANKNYLMVELGDSLLDGCTNINDVSVVSMEALERIGHYAFYGTGISTFTVPKSVTRIGVGAFNVCRKLKELILMPGSRSWDGRFYYANHADFKCYVKWTSYSAYKNSIKVWSGEESDPVKPVDRLHAYFLEENDNTASSFCVDYPVDWNASGLNAYTVYNYQKSEQMAYTMQVTSTPAATGLIVDGFKKGTLYKLQRPASTPATPQNLLVGTTDATADVYAQSVGYCFDTNNKYFWRPTSTYNLARGYAYLKLSSTLAGNTTKIEVDLWPKAKKGDVNGDGEVNVSDVTALINKILGTATYTDKVCDINADGQVNVSDVTALINMILG